MWYLPFRVWLTLLWEFPFSSRNFFILLKPLKNFHVYVCWPAFGSAVAHRGQDPLSSWSPLTYWSIIFYASLWQFRVPGLTINSSIHFDSVYFLLCVSVLPACGIYIAVMLCPKEVRNGPGYPGTGLQMVVSLQVCARNQSGVLCKSSKGF